MLAILDEMIMLCYHQVADIVKEWFLKELEKKTRELNYCVHYEYNIKNILNKIREYKIMSEREQENYIPKKTKTVCNNCGAMFEFDDSECSYREWGIRVVCPCCGQ